MCWLNDFFQKYVSGYKCVFKSVVYKLNNLIVIIKRTGSSECFHSAMVRLKHRLCWIICNITLHFKLRQIGLGYLKVING